MFVVLDWTNKTEMEPEDEENRLSTVDHRNSLRCRSQPSSIRASAGCICALQIEMFRLPWR
jgi:hypothetical protein